MIIGVCGKAGAGKDTVADFLVKDHGFVKVALADPLKRIAKDVFDFTDEQLWGPSSERNKPDERYPRDHKWYMPMSDNIMACSMCGDIQADTNSMSIKPCFLTARWALQQLGTEWGRACYPNVWVDYALRMAKDLLANRIRYSTQQGALVGGTNIEEKLARGVVISDVRFRNEVDAIKAAGGQVWRIDRPGAGLTGAAAQHISEKEQDGIPPELFNIILNNGNKSLEQLQQLVSVAAGTKQT